MNSSLDSKQGIMRWLRTKVLVLRFVSGNSFPDSKQGNMRWLRIKVVDIIFVLDGDCHIK